jgi:hypothetical protein
MNQFEGKSERHNVVFVRATSDFVSQENEQRPEPLTPSKKDSSAQLSDLSCTVFDF